MKPDSGGEHQSVLHSLLLLFLRLLPQLSTRRDLHTFKTPPLEYAIPSTNSFWLPYRQLTVPLNDLLHRLPATMNYISKFKMWPAVTITALIISILTTPIDAFFRHLCHGQVGMGRIDPIVSPGKTSAHVHNIQGAVSK